MTKLTSYQSLYQLTIARTEQIMVCAIYMGTFTWEHSHGNIYMGTFTWEHLHGNIHMGTFTWEHSQGNIHMGSFTWEHSCGCTCMYVMIVSEDVLVCM